jgi:hypothetical protein
MADLLASRDESFPESSYGLNFNNATVGNHEKIQLHRQPDHRIVAEVESGRKISDICR